MTALTMLEALSPFDRKWSDLQISSSYSPLQEGDPRSVLRAAYSHSIVAGGLPEMSYTTREIPETSLTMRSDTWARNS